MYRPMIREQCTKDNFFLPGRAPIDHGADIAESSLPTINGSNAQKYKTKEANATARFVKSVRGSADKIHPCSSSIISKIPSWSCGKRQSESTQNPAKATRYEVLNPIATMYIYM